MKAKLIETTNIHEQRIWIVCKNEKSKVFYKKSEAKKHKEQIDK